jgi:hypothetical protein
MVQDQGDKPNVVSMFSRIKDVDAAAAQPQDVAELSFAEIMKKNKEVEEKMKKERNKQNRAVLRSYRIK